jgi:LysM repeat protein
MSLIHHSFVIVVIAILSLSACERPVPRDDEDTEVVPTAPVVLPTTPSDTPAYPPPETAEPENPTPVPTTEASPTETSPEPTAEPAEPTAVPTTETAAETTHVVQAGETLFQIAQRYGVTVQDIAAANNLTNVNVLEVGQTLVIPGAGSSPAATPAAGERVHVVQPGENLFRIGLQYGFTVDELASYNGLANPNAIEVGQTIRIPPGG